MQPREVRGETVLKKIDSALSSLKPAVTRQLWAIIQSVALICAIVAPVLFKVDESRSIASHVSVREVSYTPAHKTISLSSEILKLPAPSDAAGDLHYEFQARQIRFESPTVAQRRPASSVSQWKLHRIEKVEKDGQKEALDLFSKNSEKHQVSTSFLELSEGENLYWVAFRNQKNLERGYWVRVKHVRKNNPS